NLSISNPKHIYEPSKDPSAHPSLRRLNKQAYEQMNTMSRASLCQEYLQGRTPIQALLDNLKKGLFEYDFMCDSEDHITHLFFSHNKSIKLTQAYPTVLLMDCTYKMNKFKMLLLNIVGVTSFNITFFSCFVFLKNENKEDYEWALIWVFCLFNRIDKPKVIITDCELALVNALEKKVFLQGWTNVMRSKTEEDFTIQWQKLCTNYVYEQYIKALSANPLPTCTGLPCVHTIKSRLVAHQILNIHDINQQWWIDKDQQDLAEDD
ncbi:33003_t:CDS:2, partial [Racocetra persica]